MAKTKPQEAFYSVRDGATVDLTLLDGSAQLAWLTITHPTAITKVTLNREAATALHLALGTMLMRSATELRKLEPRK